jgi:hypothetical protein
VNCFGGFFEKQNNGGVNFASGRNYSIGSAGLSLFQFDGGLGQGGIEAEDNAHVTHSLLKVLNDNSVNLYAVSSAGIVFVNNSGGSVGKIASGAFTPYGVGSLGLGSNAIPFPGLFFGNAAINNAQLTGTFTAARTHTAPDSTGTLLISGNGDGTHSIANQTKRVSGCATAASLNATCDTTFTWTTPFADANYTVVCTGDGVTGGAPGIQGTNIVSAKTAAASTVRTFSITAAAAQFTTIDCEAVHD